MTYSRHVKRARRELEAVIDDILERRRTSDRTHDDLLSLLLSVHAAHDASATGQLKDDALTFLLAGHDTMTHALTWTWVLLAEHPDADAALYRELDAVLGPRLPAAEDVPRLTYTRSVLAESLRLFPPAWVIVRRAVNSHACGNAHVPAGALVVASPFAMHRDSRYFPPPDRFVPERWLASPPSSGGCPSSEPSRFAYFPFGVGPRSCVGESFAWMEGTLVLATLAQSWRLSSSRAVRPVPRITLRPDGPVPMIARARRAHGARHHDTVAP